MTSEEQLAGGRYTIRGILGRGGQGTTYDAVDTRDGSAVAIKRFDVRGARSWKDVELAEREARVLATLDHPLVPRYIEHFEEDGALYLVMEKVEGETLEAIRRREGPMPEAEVRRFLADTDRALTYLHGRAARIVHRDIKPRNVVRSPDGSYVLVDFGSVSERLLRGSGSSTVVGTLGYMAPEQLQGRALPATDVYAAGATALAALTGVEPEALPHRGLHVDVGEAVKGRASAALERALARMLEPDPDRRAQSLAEALDPRDPAEPLPGGASAALLPAETAKEDALVKSLRSLLWALWGLGWIVVPVTLTTIGLGRWIPVVMFTSLMTILVVTWHKGAALRAAVRMLARERLPEGAGASRPRVEVFERPVRVAPAEALKGEEDVEEGEEERQDAAARAADRR